MAADAHKAVQVQHGGIVVLRNVSARPADREVPPGMALVVLAVSTRFITATAYAQDGGNDPHSGDPHKVKFDKKVELSTDVSLKGDPSVHGNIGINAASGSGNQQANSLAVAIAQPGAGGGKTAP